MNPTLAKAAANLKRRAGSRLPAVWLMSDAQRLPDPEIALRTLPRGSALILRHTKPTTLAQLARRFAPLCKQRGLVLLIAGDWRLAAAVGAAGIHMSEQSARAGLAPGGRLWARGRIVTAAAHGAAGLRAGKNASAVLLAPVFATKSHPGQLGLGAAKTAAWVRSSPVPVIALGGISTATINTLRHSGCAGIAGISFAL